MTTVWTHVPITQEHDVVDASWKTKCALISNVAYAVALLVVVVYLTVTSGVTWFMGDKVLSAYVAIVALFSYAFHDQLYQPTNKQGKWAQLGDSVFTVLVIVTLCLRVATNDEKDDTEAALAYGLPVLFVAAAAATSAANMLQRHCVSRAAKKKIYVTATLLIGAGTCAVGAAHRDRNVVYISAGAVCLAIACASWYSGSNGFKGEGHAMWHLFSAATIAFLWLSCHIPHALLIN